MFLNRSAVAVVLALALTVLLWLLAPSWTTPTVAAPKPSAISESADFKNKVLLLRFEYGMESVVLEQVKVRQFGDRAFLVGKVVEAQSGKDSLKGKTVWQNVDHIAQIIECENADEAKKTLKTLPGAGIGVLAPQPGIAVPPGFPPGPPSR